MKTIALLIALTVSTTAIGGTITEGVRTAEVKNKDELGYRFNALTAGLLAIKFEPSLVDSTNVLENLLSGLSCDSIKLASDEFTWREKRPALANELKNAAASFSATEFYVMGNIRLGDYNFEEKGFPFNGNMMSFNITFLEGAPVGGMTGRDGWGGDTAMYNPFSGVTNQRSLTAFVQSPKCSLYVKSESGNSGGRELSVEIVGTPYLLDSVLPVSEADAKVLISKYPRREFVLLQQYTISGAELSRNQKRLFLRADPWKFSLCETTNPRFVDVKGYSRSVDPYCTKVILPLEMRALTKPYNNYIGELPSWAAAGGAGASGAATKTIRTSDIVNGIGSLFGRAKKALSKESEESPPDATKTEAPKTAE